MVMISIGNEDERQMFFVLWSAGISQWTSPSKVLISLARKRDGQTMEGIRQVFATHWSGYNDAATPSCKANITKYFQWILPRFLLKMPSDVRKLIIF